MTAYCLYLYHGNSLKLYTVCIE